MDHRRGPRVIRWRSLGWLLSLAALGFMARWLWQLDRQVWTSLTRLQPWFLLWSVGLFQVWLLTRYAAWHWISRRHGSQLLHRQNIRLWTISELMRYIPGNVWSFAARYRGTMSSGGERAATFQALIVEVLGLVAGATVISALLIQRAGGWAVALSIMAAVPIFAAMARPLAQKVFRRELPQIGVGEMSGLMLWYGLGWIVFGLATSFVFRSFPDIPPLAWTQLIGLNVFAWLIGYVTIVTPMGLGVRELAFVRLLDGVVLTAVASLVALVTRLWFIVSELVFLGLVMTLSGRRTNR